MPPQSDTPLPLAIPDFILDTVPSVFPMPSSDLFPSSFSPSLATSSPAQTPSSVSPSVPVSHPTPSPSVSSTADPVVLPPRRSSRPHQPPFYLQDYHYHALIPSSSLPHSHHALVSLLTQYTEQSSFEEASKDPGWVQAMNKEIQALLDNNTWDFVDLPPGKKAISSKWVYKVKLHSDGTLERLKAWLVIRGFTQKYGVDYLEVFSPVVKMATIRTVIALATAKGWGLYQLDVNNAFLLGDLDAEVYMTVPQGLPNPTNKVCHLRKSLYGLKQASRQWFQKLSTTLFSLGYQQSKHDYSLFLNKFSTDLVIIAVYVDDILITGSNKHDIDRVKHHLDQCFGIKDLGTLHYFLGLEVTHLPQGIVLSHNKFTQDLL